MNVEEKAEMLRKMSDEKLYEYYITARNALEEYGHDDYKSLHHKLANIMWRIYDKLLQHDDLHAAFNSAKIKDDVEYNDIAIAATESDDIIRGIDQQIKRNAKSR